MRDDDLYLRLLRYGIKNSKKGFTFDEIKKDLHLSDSEASFLRDEIQGSDVIGRSKELRGGENINNNQVWYLSFAKRSEYLDYLELKQARESGKAAKTIAIISIFISAFLALSQVLLSELTPNSILYNFCKQIGVSCSIL